MKKIFMRLAIMIVILFSVQASTHASWGWEHTDDPAPYYHQEWGKWYHYDDSKVFMVQIEDNTYKYVFDYNDNFIGGWITSMPIRLP